MSTARDTATTGAAELAPSSSSSSSAETSPAEGRSGRRRDRSPLTRQLVLQAALDLIDAEGLEALTMRRLGQQLGRDPMALYRHTANRDDVLDGVVELVLSRLQVVGSAAEVHEVHEVRESRRGAADGGRASAAAVPARWGEQLREVAHTYRRLALAHPHVVPLLVTRPLATPLGLRPLGTLRPLEQLLELLVGAGFDPVSALHVYRLYFGFLNGHVLNELQELVADPDEDEALLRLGLHHLPLREFPRLRSLAGALADYDGAAELDEGLQVLLTGLTARLAPVR